MLVSGTTSFVEKKPFKISVSCSIVREFQTERETQRLEEDPQFPTKSSSFPIQVN